MPSAVDTAAPEGSVFPTLSDSLTAGTVTFARFDRLMMRLSIGYPADGTEVEMLQAQRELHPIRSPQPVMDGNPLTARPASSSKPA